MALALPATLPQMPLPVLDGNNFTLPWYRLLQALSAARNNAVDPAVIALIEAQIAALQAAIAAIEAEIAALPTAGGSEALTFALTSLLDGFFTVRDAKHWTTGRTITLTGDTTGVSAAFSGSANLSFATVGVQAAKWTTPRALSFTGDATGTNNVDGSAAVATALTLATVNSSVGTFGDSTHVGQVTLNGKGLATAAVSVAIAFPVPAVTFGTGAPGGTPAAGALYFDTTLATYVGYVGHGGAWNQIA